MALDIRKLLSRYRITWRDRGKNCSQGFINIQCPLCGDADKSFHLRINESQLWWYCLRSPKHRGRDLEYLSYLLKIDSAEVPSNPNVPAYPNQSVVACVSRDFNSEFEPAQSSNEAMDYLIKRKFEYPEELSEKCNLRVAQVGSWAGRLLIPLTIGWTGRSIRSWIEPKYKSETTAAGFLKLGKGTTAILVEGPLDALKVHATVDNILIIAMLGGRISPSVLQFINFEKMATIVLVPDSDVTPSHRVSLLNELRVNCPLSKVISGNVPIDNKDFGDMTEDEVRNWIYKL